MSAFLERVSVPIGPHHADNAPHTLHPGTPDVTRVETPTITYQER
jgi:hypothetical protein